MKSERWLVHAGLFVLLAISGVLSTEAQHPAMKDHSDKESHGHEQLVERRPYVSDTVLEMRDFPLLTLMKGSKEVEALVEGDAELQQIGAERWAAAKQANKECKEEDITCKTAALELSPAAITKTSAALGRIYDEHAEMREFVSRGLTPAAEFSLNAGETERQRLTGSWERTAAWLNQMIATYGVGAAPRYKEIDSIAYTANSQSWAALIQIILDGLPLDDQSVDQEGLFFEPSLRFAVRLLQANSRDEAGRFWPLEKGENASALAKAATVEWPKYAYSAILIPGAGSEIAGVQLSPWAKERLRLGVAAFRAGKAPFLLVSGGFVHPSQTPWCEAVEMKRYLMEVYGIPEEAILIDPYARHTTTNLRSAVREILTYGLPARKAILIVSDAAQIDYIMSNAFSERSKDELGYAPMDALKRLSATEVEATPSVKSLFRDASDPLDP